MERITLDTDHLAPGWPLSWTCVSDFVGGSLFLPARASTPLIRNSSSLVSRLFLMLFTSEHVLLL
jgi:hypothetical protein